MLMYNQCNLQAHIIKSNILIIMLRVYFRFTLIVLITLLTYVNTEAQYFFKDIWNTRQLNKEMSLLKSEKINAISIKSFENDGMPSEGFFCEKRIDKNYTVAETVTKSDITTPSVLATYFNLKGHIIKTSDSTESALSITEYLYNDKDQVTAVNTFTKSGNDINAASESHIYTYTASGNLEKMIRKKNDAQLSIINFKVDENGNVIEEEELFTNRAAKKYFYYYDTNNNLTDVVHYNERAKRLLPDYMYEYHTTGQIKQMIILEDGGGYYIWQYTYNDQNLREKEICFSKEKKLLGSVQYLYK